MTDQPPDSPGSQGSPGSLGSQPEKCFGWLLFNLVILSLALHLWGIRKDLPISQDIDEYTFAAASLRVAGTGDLNPYWFGNPGSTVIYPFAAVMRLWYRLEEDVPLFQPVEKDLRPLFRRELLDHLYLLGRYITIAYGVLCVPLIFLLGRRAFNAQVGALGSFLFIISPIAVAHAQIVRTDSAGTFFGLLALWLCLRAFDQPTLRNHALAGIAIGLSISSRYFMVMLLPFLILLDVVLMRRRPAVLPGERLVAAALLGCLVALITFALTSPYVFLDVHDVMVNLRKEARSIHLGADGLTPVGNYLWYITSAIPNAIKPLQTILVGVGIAAVGLKRMVKPLALLAAAAIFLLGISLSPLHWQRWIIQVLPVLALFSAYAIVLVCEWIGRVLKLKPPLIEALVIAGALAVAAQPAYHLVYQNVRQSRPSTRVQARQWIIEHLPEASKIAQDSNGIPLSDTSFENQVFFTLAQDRELSDYPREGFQYLVANAYMYNRYYAEPQRYTREISFYETLFRDGELLKRFRPTLTQGGPEIRIYRYPAVP
jgi:hypothetical protein